jgi:SAM-dependent methyltransferase
MLAKGLSSEDYNAILAGDRTYQRPTSSPYYPLFCRVRDRVQAEGLRSVLEVGCGTGVLAEMLINQGLSYTGFDFSPVGVNMAQRRGPGGKFFVADAADPAAYQVSYEGIVCCEVLEHIDGDLQVIENWQSGAACICSVPNFDGEHHVRFFRSEAEIEQRYGGLIEIRQFERIATSPSANLSWREYFRRIRWARNEPKRLLGIAGINRFEWYSGWFVFIGRRR